MICKYAKFAATMVVALALAGCGFTEFVDNLPAYDPNEPVGAQSKIGVESKAAEASATPLPKRKPITAARRAAIKFATARQKLRPSLPKMPAVVAPQAMPGVAMQSPIPVVEEPLLKPAVLMGLNRADTIALLGYPSQVREKPPSTVWSYWAEECALDLFFYMDLGSNALKVLTYDLKAGAKSDAAKGACLDRLRTVYDAKR